MHQRIRIVQAVGIGAVRIENQRAVTAHRIAVQAHHVFGSRTVAQGVVAAHIAAHAHRVFVDAVHIRHRNWQIIRAVDGDGQCGG